MERNNYSLEGVPDRAEIVRLTVERIRDEIKTLIHKSTLVYGLQNLDQTKLPSGQQADVCIDSLSEYAEAIREYLETESSIITIREEEPKPGRKLFYLKINS